MRPRRLHGRIPRTDDLKAHEHRQHRVASTMCTATQLRSRDRAKDQEVARAARRQVAAVVAQPPEHLRAPALSLRRRVGGVLALEHPLYVIDVADPAAREQAPEKRGEVTAARDGREVVDRADAAGGGKCLKHTEAERGASNTAAGECKADGVVRQRRRRRLLLRVARSGRAPRGQTARGNEPRLVRFQGRGVRIGSARIETFRRGIAICAGCARILSNRRWPHEPHRRRSFVV